MRPVSNQRSSPSPGGSLPPLPEGEVYPHAPHEVDQPRNNANYGTSATNRFRRTPIFSISTSTTSLGCRKTGGLRAPPTPGGVPVKITSPACSVQTLER